MKYISIRELSFIMTHYRRRIILALSGTGLAGLAGCSGGSGSGSDEGGENDGGGESGGSGCGPGENEIGAIDSDTSGTVTITGQVTSFDSTTGTAVVDDGTGQAGVRLGLANIADPAEGDCITATGTPGGATMGEDTDITITTNEASMAGDDDSTD